MSHFNVAVFSHSPDEVDTLLAPFIEQVEPNSPYAEFVEDEEGVVDAAAGKKGYWHNPNARWDWYCVGGRWCGQLKLLEGRKGWYGSDYSAAEREKLEQGRCDSARVADCDFSSDQEVYEKALRFWDVVVDGMPVTEEEKNTFFSIYKPEYYRHQYGSRENYARNQADFLTYAFVTPDGEWHETGHMGWWGMDDATAESRDAYNKAFEAFLAEAKEQNLMITIVDCHI